MAKFLNVFLTVEQIASVEKVSILIVRQIVSHLISKFRF